MRLSIAPYAAGFALWALAASSVLAQDAEAEYYTIEGVELKLSQSEDFERILSWKDESIHQGYLLYVEGVEQVAGREVLVGQAGAGGSVCSGDEFVIWISSGRPVLEQLDDSCTGYQRSNVGEELQYVSAAFPDHPGRVLNWSPGIGFVEAEEIEYGPIEGTTWAGFAQSEDLHPVRVLQIQPVWDALEAGLGDESFTQLRHAAADLGSGQFLETGQYAGHSCLKWECDEGYVWLWADTAAGHPYVIWKATDMAAPGHWPEDLTTWPQWVILHAAEKFSE